MGMIQLVEKSLSHHGLGPGAVRVLLGVSEEGGAVEHEVPAGWGWGPIHMDMGVEKGSTVVPEEVCWRSAAMRVLGGCIMPSLIMPGVESGRGMGLVVAGGGVDMPGIEDCWARQATASRGAREGAECGRRTESCEGPEWVIGACRLSDVAASG